MREKIKAPSEVPLSELVHCYMLAAFAIVEFWDSVAATITFLYTFFFSLEEVRFTNFDNGVEATFLSFVLFIKASSLP